MLTAKQIADIIENSLAEHEKRGSSFGTKKAITIAAEKIAAAIPDYPAMMVSAAALENEVTSHLMDMLAATIMATLFEEEGGGRSNISYSPMSMKHMTDNYEFTSEIKGMVRTIRISLRPESELNNPEAWRKPSNRHGIMTLTNDEVQEAGLGGAAKPQAEERVYDRPLWAIAHHDEDGTLKFAKMADRWDAARRLGSYKVSGQPWPTIQNRFCLHTECPASGCTRQAEVASEA